MSDPQNPARPSEPTDDDILVVREDEVETDVVNDTVTVRRAPRFGRFIALGVVVGAIVALILTFSFSGEPAPELGLDFDRGQVFGFLLLLCGVIGAALGAVVALLIDRATARRAKSVVAEHSSTHHIDE
ncbi:potassium transporter Trk [Agromyces humatus]|uniref:Potassium transporter Trk n=1 Tax=Agromyces humatus TaxID=279573 RepID=A0ABN2KJ34_9MICO|nr:potassium transporter Trk [Agromyces humatus]